MERPSRLEEISPPFFIVGAPRAGTTLLSRILDRHSRIAVYHESHYYPLFRHDFHRYGELRRPANLKRFVDDLREVARVQGFMDPLTATEFIEAIGTPTFEGVFAALLQFHAHKQGKIRGADKTPEHHAYLAEILKNFPASPVLFVMRDPRDTALSIRRALGSTLQSAARRWNAAFADYRRFASQVHLVRYEELVNQPLHAVQTVCALLGEPFEPEMLRFFERIPDSLAARPNFRKLLKAVDADSVGNFRQMPRPEIEYVEAACAEGMEALGYAFTDTRPKPVSLPPPTKLDFLLDRLRYYRFDRQRWRRGWMRWKIVLRVRARHLFSLAFQKARS